MREFISMLPSSFKPRKATRRQETSSGMRRANKTLNELYGFRVPNMTLNVSGCCCFDVGIPWMFVVFVESWSHAVCNKGELFGSAARCYHTADTTFDCEGALMGEDKPFRQHCRHWYQTHSQIRPG